MCNIVYCNFTKCKQYRLLEEPVEFRVGTRYKSLYPQLFYGKCAIDDNEAFCGDFAWSCGGCAFSGEHGCLRDSIFVGADGRGWCICKCRSDSRISGHKDWFQNLNSDGTPKGGHIDDDYAKKMDKDRKINKSFPDHLRQKS